MRNNAHQHKTDGAPPTAIITRLSVGATAPPPTRRCPSFPCSRRRRRRRRAVKYRFSRVDPDATITSCRRQADDEAKEALGACDEVGDKRIVAERGQTEREFILPLTHKQ